LTPALEKPFDVLLAGYFGFGNLGDELLTEAAVLNLEDCGLPRQRMAILSNDPPQARSRFGTEAFNRWKILSVFRALNMSRCLLLAGGGLFQDASSSRSCAYYWGLVRAAAAKSVPVAALGQSVGPLSGAFSKLLARNALSSCKYIAVRDAASAEKLSSMRILCRVMPDPVMSLKVDEGGEGDDVLVNIRPTPGSNECARSVAWAARVAGKSGFKLVCVAMSQEDACLMEDFQQSGELPGSEIVIAKTLADFSSVARGAKTAIGMRLHFGILSMLSGLSVALSPYDPKVSSFANAWDIKQLKNEKNCKNFDIMPLLTNSQFRDKRKFAEIRSLVSEQFQIALDHMLGEDNGRGKMRRA
jgi:polysaccharide pyruvyl transferase CsaB